MLLSYAIQYVHQKLKFEGLNLADKHYRDLLVQTPEIQDLCINNLGDDQFCIQSAMDKSHIYISVNLSTQSCDCPDWPQVQLCKHVTAIAHLFRNSDQQIDMELPKPTKPIQDGSLAVCTAEASTASIMESIIAISRALLSDGELLPETVCSLQMVESHLAAIVHISHYPPESVSSLPDKETILPNQGNWNVTAEQMGVTMQQ
jgi:hypothetical protein